MSGRFDKSGKLLPPAPEALAEADDETDILVLDTGTFEDGTAYWAYIAVRPSLYPDFMKRLKRREEIVFEEYGAILKHGSGEIPSGVREEMKREYDFDEYYVERLKSQLVGQQTEFLKERENRRIGDIVAVLKQRREGAE